MPTYVMLGNISAQGMENMTESPERLENVKELTASVGGEFVAFYLTFGQYDFVYIAEYPDDEAAAHVALTYGMTGVGETETLRAFTEEEYREVVADL